ncbi:unnamed protein product [Closterium sp. NIES-65]|nr:unnamed protein product [Closterium sp. NIES-65]
MWKISRKPSRPAPRCTYQASTPPPHPSFDSHPPFASSSLPQQSPPSSCCLFFLTSAVACACVSSPLPLSTPAPKCTYQSFHPSGRALECTCQPPTPPHLAIDSHPPVASSSLPQQSPVLVCPPLSPYRPALKCTCQASPPLHPTLPLTAILLLPLLPYLSSRLWLCVLPSPLPDQFSGAYIRPTPLHRQPPPCCLFFLPHPDYTAAFKALAFFFVLPSLQTSSQVQISGLHPSIDSQPPAAKAVRQEREKLELWLCSAVESGARKERRWGCFVSAGSTQQLHDDWVGAGALAVARPQAGAGAPGEMRCSVVQHGALAGVVIVKSTQQLIIQQLHDHRLVLVLQVERGGAELELASDGIYDAWKASDVQMRMRVPQTLCFTGTGLLPQVERGGAELELASDGIYGAWKATDDFFYCGLTEEEVK